MNEPRLPYPEAQPSRSRQQVLEVLAASSLPLDASAVAQQLGLHVTTARFHLEQLTAAGLTARRPGAEHRRGRPRMLYALAGTPRDEHAREQLIAALALAVSGTDDPTGAAVRAGGQWATTLVRPDPNDPVPQLVELLERLGFDPEVGTSPAVIRLRACPFRDVARAHPDVVCSVHRGLIEGLLDKTTSRASLLPFVEPDLCAITMDEAPQYSRLS